MNDRILAQQTWLGCNGILSLAAFAVAALAAVTGSLLLVAGARNANGLAEGFR